MPIVLLSDFGVRSHIPGVIKGIIAGIAPDVQVIDLTHELSRDMRVAAFTLLRSISYFPTGTIFCVVSGVDKHRPIAAQAGPHFFVGRDDGVLSYALYAEAHAWVVDATHALDDSSGQPTTVGWEMLPAIAALLHEGAPLETLGDADSEIEGIAPPTFSVTHEALHGEVVAVEGGTALTSFGQMRWTEPDMLTLRPLVGDGVWTLRASTTFVSWDRQVINGIVREANDIKPAAVVNGAGFLEIVGGPTLTQGHRVSMSLTER